jgi:UDP-2,3-diacylglucosamine pyrophosphatase LpxH
MNHSESCSQSFSNPDVSNEPADIVHGIPHQESPLHESLIGLEGAVAVTQEPLPSQQLKVYVVSDVHLNDHVTNPDFDLANPRREGFRRFLERLNQETAEHAESLKTVLVLNGDILDMTGSWFEDLAPWEGPPEVIERHALCVLERIIGMNRHVFKELSLLAQSRQVELVYVIGNHDGMLRLFHRLRERLHEEVGPIVFRDDYHQPDLDLYAAHGHQFDFFNQSNELIEHPLGDYINIVIVNRFVDMVVLKMQEEGYTPSLIASVNARLHDIEYLRPFSLIPLWVETMAKSYKRHPENEGKNKSIDGIIYWVLAEVLDTDATRQLVEQLQLPRKFLTNLVNWFIRLPGTLPVTSFLISQAMRRTHSNRFQFRMAQKIFREKGYRYITFGHTHIPQVLPLGENGYFFNTGSWKPVVNLFKEASFAVQDTNLEYLTPGVSFNKIERSSILVMEQSLDHPDQMARPVQFALETHEGSRTFRQD